MNGKAKAFVVTSAAVVVGVLAVGFLFKYADDMPIIKQAKSGF